MLNFDPEKEYNRIIKFIRDYFDAQPSAKGAIIGISGGKDSTIVAKLLVDALGKDRVLGVLMPQWYQKDINDSFDVINHLDIPFKEVNIGSIVDDFILQTEARCSIKEVPIELSDQAIINIAPRIRMTVLYAISATLHYRVCGTGNFSEKFIGYTTKFGDNACDFNPIAHLTCREVIRLGEFMGLPSELIHKAPSDGLTGLTDEDNLGVSYDKIDDYIDLGSSGCMITDEYIQELHAKSIHKTKMPIVLKREN